MTSTMTDADMVAYWQAHDFEEVVLVDAKPFDDAGQLTAFVDSTRFSLGQRLEFTAAVVNGVRQAADSALRAKRRTVLILKQIKGAGSHGSGSKSHHLYPQFTLQHPEIVGALRRRALAAEAWPVVRENHRRAAGGPAAKVAFTERERPLATIESLPLHEFPVGGESQVPSSALGPLVAAIGAADPEFVATSADGNEASGLRAVNDALRIRHPVRDAVYSQAPDGRVFEPISEDACAGLAAAYALMGGRSVWFSYESFAVNGLPVWQTATQAMAELRRRTPSAIAMFTAGALEQGRNGWTHQRPEIENYFMALARNGNVHPVFPIDANSMQAAYAWATTTSNQGIVILGGKTAVPVRLTLAQSRAALRDGAIALHESENRRGTATIVLAAVGDLILGAVWGAKDILETAGYSVRIVAVVAPRRLYRAADVAWDKVTLPDARDDGFLDAAGFNALFDGDALLGITGGASATLEPVLLRTRARRRDVAAWQRGETTAGLGQLLVCNQLDPASLAQRAIALAETSSEG
jgi:phosphoketolase